MKVKIRDLKPNPFRDMKSYPINEEKIKSLTNSINETGFWDNILARKGNNKIEIAYGHHRLVVLKKIFKPGDYIDIPIKELDDETMIKIMANENDEHWRTTPAIVNETVKVTKKFLEEHPEIVGAADAASITHRKISTFLGGHWDRRKVHRALELLKFFKDKKYDKEAVESLPTEHNVRTFVKALKQIYVKPKQQRQVVKRIIESQDFSELGMKNALLDEKYSKEKTEKSQREKYEIHFKNYMVDTTKIIKSLNDRFLALFELQNKYNFTFEIYNNSDEADKFKGEMLILIDYLKKFSKKGGKNSEEDKLLQISD